MIMKKAFFKIVFRHLALPFVLFVPMTLAMGSAPQEKEGQISTGQKLMNLLKEPQTSDPRSQKSTVAKRKTSTKRPSGVKTKKARVNVSPVVAGENPAHTENATEQISQTTGQINPTKPDIEHATTQAGMSGEAKVIGGGVLVAAIIFITIKRRNTMKWFYNLKIGTKLIGAFAVVLILTVVVGYTGVTSLNNIIPSFQSMYVDRLDPAMDLAKAVDAMYEIRLGVINHYVAGNKNEERKFEEGIVEQDAEIDQIIKKYSATYLVEEEKQQLAEFNTNLADYNQKRSHSVELSASGRKAEALANIKEVAGPAFKKALTNAQNLLAIQGKVGKELYNSSEQTASNAKYMLYVVIGVAIVLGLLLAIFIARVISNPVKQLAGQAETVAAGDLTVEVVQKSNDEIGQLAGSFKQMVQNLRETIGQVGEASSAVASSSSEISSSTEQMAAGAQEQTSQASEVASAVEEMTKTIVENSKNANNTAETAKKAKSAAEEGGKAVEETVVGMKRIADVVNKSAETVKALGKSSDQIGEIIGVIDDIADQTNLLALNAAIEAARAGEQGRGFAVVADEVRKLAERTTKATKEIAGMIKTIQADTTGAVSSMEEGTKEVDNGIKLADRAGASLSEIVGMIQNLTDMVAQIAAASEQQSSASEQISKNVEAISSVTNESAAGTQQIARAAEDLNRLTENLQQVVGKFKLSATETHHTAAAHKQNSTTRKSATKSAEQKSKLAVRENGALVPHEEQL
jgi:methyl-accepting chemotaxis protein